MKTPRILLAAFATLLTLLLVAQATEANEIVSVATKGYGTSIEATQRNAKWLAIVGAPVVATAPPPSCAHPLVLSVLDFFDATAGRRRHTTLSATRRRGAVATPLCELCGPSANSALEPWCVEFRSARRAVGASLPARSESSPHPPQAQGSREGIEERRNANAQIDLLIDRRDGIVNLCEMKYWTGPYAMTAEDAAALAEKKAEFKAATKSRKAVHLTMVTTFGVKRNAYAGSVQSFVTLDDLFRK